MTIEIIHEKWADKFQKARAQSPDLLLIACPFIKLAAIKNVIGTSPCENIRVVTRFNKLDFAKGVSDISALRFLHSKGAEIRGIKGLHSKLYIFENAAILTSANLTTSAFYSNYEFGCRLGDDEQVDQCRRYFDKLWRSSKAKLTLDDLDRWEKEVEAQRAKHQANGEFEIEDEGTDIGLANLSRIPIPFLDAPESFAKFFGTNNDRADREAKTIDIVKGNGCHFAGTYPKSKRPVSVPDGSCIFMTQLAKDPNDLIVFGRAIGMEHIHERDYASPRDIERRPWKKDWPLYLRVHSGEFVGGTLNNGVSLKELFKELGSDSTASTKRNKASGSGKNTNPLRAVRQQAHVHLTPEAALELNIRLQNAFDRHGTIPQTEIAALDKPTLPVAT